MTDNKRGLLIALGTAGGTFLLGLLVALVVIAGTETEGDRKNRLEREAIQRALEAWERQQLDDIHRRHFR